ncbi:MAG: hypothetical protein VKN72_14080 [Nostocales cyanobacterium 94392]|nr:hypothetical protein [Rivularia sp. T60_A2020_040]MEB3217342.1 hypothetical protein [Nostocales cyanobacterium 94392]
MNTSVELPSGKILNIARFIALLPDDNSNYQLILEGYPNPINIESSDAQTLKQILELAQEKKANPSQSGWDKEQQLQKNQKAIALLAKRIQQHQNMSDEEAREREEFFEEFKQIIDEQRSPGQKLYLQS